MRQNECIQTLMDLGLTLLQARVYLALCKAGNATVKIISKATQVARQDIYRIMPRLQELGLVEQILAAPTIYKATPIKQGCHLLFQNNVQKHLKLQKKTMELIKKLDKSDYKTTPQKEQKKEMSISQSKALLWKWIRERNNTTQKTIDLMIPFNVLKLTLFDHAEDYKRAIKKGVKIRVITEKSENDNAIQKTLQNIEQKSLFAIRYLSQPVPVETRINDGKEVGLSLAMTHNVGVPVLWSTYPQLVKITEAYFETLWNEALDSSETHAELTPSQTRSAQLASK